MKVAELTGAELDYWVARALGMKDGMSYSLPDWFPKVACFDDAYRDPFEPSQRWDHGGPIIERLPQLRIQQNADGYAVQVFTDPNCLIPVYGYGDTILLAAMRAYVASKFGDSVPDEVR